MADIFTELLSYILMPAMIVIAAYIATKLPDKKSSK